MCCDSSCPQDLVDIGSPSIDPRDSNMMCQGGRIVWLQRCYMVDPLLIWHLKACWKSRYLPVSSQLDDCWNTLKYCILKSWHADMLPLCKLYFDILRSTIFSHHEQPVRFVFQRSWQGELAILFALSPGLWRAERCHLLFDWGQGRCQWTLADSYVSKILVGSS